MEILPKIYVFGQVSVGKATFIHKFKETLNLRDSSSDEVPITQSSGAILDVEIVDIDLNDVDDTFSVRPFNVFIAVYDVTNKSSFDEIIKVIGKQKKNQKFVNLIIVANKIDVDTSDHEVTKSEGEAISNRYKGSSFYQVSSLNDSSKINGIFVKAADIINSISEKDSDVTCGCLIS